MQQYALICKPTARLPGYVMFCALVRGMRELYQVSAGSTGYQRSR